MLSAAFGVLFTPGREVQLHRLLRVDGGRIFADRV